MGTKIRDKFVEHMRFSDLAKQTQIWLVPLSIRGGLTLIVASTMFGW